MKIFFAAIGILYAVTCTAQRELDYQDTRRKTESFAKFPKGDIRNDLAAFTLSGISESVGKAQFKKIPFTSFSIDHMTFEGDGIKAIITTLPFEPAKHKFIYDEKYLVRIDKKAYYGGYGAMPSRYISNITMTVDNDTIVIPPAAYSDIYNVNFTYSDKGVQRSTNGIYRSKDGHRIYLYLFSKDNNGSYEVTWIIQDKKYLRRVLDYDFM
ncbi:MAG: hypothetical protein M3Z56_06660 [Bacteroidota bacterium]|nr:hypothetical protein [Bacteroidota bacterium]